MNSWDILGIKPTDDMSVIKKAYAQKLKIFHPEDDPQGFQQLREAYDFAVKYSKNKKNINIYNENINNDNDQQNYELVNVEGFFEEDDNYDTDYPLFNSNFNELLNQNNQINELFDVFFEKAEKIYEDFSLRTDIKNWEELLDSHIMWDMSQRAALSNRFLDFLYEHNHLPQNIWIYLNNNFNWSEKEDLLHSNLPNYQIRLIKSKINYPYALRYDHLGFLPKNDLEEFLDLRERAFEYLLENEFIYASSKLDKAKKIFEKDPDLLRMEGIYFKSLFEYDKALKCVNEAISINIDDKESLFLRADIYNLQNQIQEAINEYLAILSIYSVDKRVYAQLADCYMKIKDFEKSKEYLLKLFEMNPSDLNTRISLINVNKDIRNKLRKLIYIKPFDINLKQRLKKTKKEIKALQRDLFIPEKNEKPLYKIYLRIAIIIVVSVGILFALNKFSSDNVKNFQAEFPETTLAPYSTPVTTVDNKKIQILINEADINNITSNTKVLAKITSMQSLQTLWMINKGTKGVETTQFISALNIEESSHLNDFLMSIGKIEGKNILIVGASNNNVYNNSDKVYLQGTIRDIPSPDVIDVVKILINKKQLYNINTNELITDKYILVDKKVNIPTQNNKSKTNNSYNYPVSTTSQGSDFPTGTAIIIVFIILYNLRKRF